MNGIESTQLRADYERVGLSGRKLLPQQPSEEDQPWSDSLERLVRAGLANYGRSEFSLQRPEYATVSLDPSDTDVLQLVYETWLRAGADPEADEMLYGELGWFQHWWNMLTGGPTRTTPLQIDTITHPDFVSRPWLTEAPPELLKHVLDGKLVSSRVIVWPTAVESPAEGLIDLVIRSGLAEVRVLAGTTPYTIYNRDTAVLTEPTDDAGQELYRLTRRASVVTPLCSLFELQWQTAVPWDHYRSGSGGVLHLLARGWTDDRIAAVLKISGRTLSRRIAALMEATGARTRFELGMRYASQGPASESSVKQMQ